VSEENNGTTARIFEKTVDCHAAQDRRFTFRNGILWGLCAVYRLAFASPYFLMPKNLINVLRQTPSTLYLYRDDVCDSHRRDRLLSVPLLAFGGIVGASLASYSMGTVYPTPMQSWSDCLQARLRGRNRIFYR
jgi:hypothetical protein